MAKIDEQEDVLPVEAGRSILIDTDLDYYYRVTGVTLRPVSPEPADDSRAIRLMRRGDTPGAEALEGKGATEQVIVLRKVDDLYFKLVITVETGPCNPLKTNCPPPPERIVVEDIFSGRFDICIKFDESTGS